MFVGAWHVLMALGALLALTSSAFIAGQDFISGVLTRRYSAFLVLGVTGVISALFVLLLIGGPSGVSMSGEVLRDGLAAGTCALASQALYLTALARGVVGVVGGIATVFVVVPLAAAFAQGVAPGAWALFGILLITAGVVALSLPDPNYCPAGMVRRTSTSVIVMALLAGLLLGISILFIERGSMLNPESTVLLQYAVAPLAIGIALFTGVRGEDDDGPGVAAVVLAGALVGASLLGLLADLTFAWSTQMSNVAVAATLSGLDPIFLAGFGLLFLKQRLTRQQWVGLVATVIGGALVTLG